VQAAFDLPLEDINARQMLKEGIELLSQLEPSFPENVYRPADMSTVLPAIADFDRLLGAALLPPESGGTVCV
jgi:hypothetical protein